MRIFEEHEELFYTDNEEEIIKFMDQKYGTGRGLFLANQAWRTVSSSRECRDCILLDITEYYDRIHECWYK